MVTNCSFLRFLLLPLTVLFLTGCGENGLVGKWTLDEERTLEELSAAENSAEPTSPGEGAVKDIVGGLKKGISRVMLTQFEGVVVEFTPSEYRHTRNGVGAVQEYEVIERPEKSVYLVKTADGNIDTWAKTDNGIRMMLTGESDTWVYFRPAE